MAIFGNLEVVKKQIDKELFRVAFEYLEQIYAKNEEICERLHSLPIGAFEKVELDDNNFALEQVYHSKQREQCFFESHKKYIDVQYIVDGEEIIEVENIGNLNIDVSYDDSIDLIKYKMTNKASSIILKKGDVAIFFPEDAHMPCIMKDTSIKVVKTVVKVALD